MKTFTPSQQAAVDARAGTVLVSAAAGSGKTAVLVQRILALLTDPDVPARIDELLVVTFTRAAASEMKQRLQTALSAALEERPDDRHLSRQLTLLPTAQICTVHSFCAALLREFHQHLELPADIRVADDADLRPLREEALAETLEAAYSAAEPGFLALSGLLARGRDDSGLVEAVDKLYDFTQSYPDPGAWLDAQLTEEPLRLQLDAVGQRVASERRAAAALLRRALRLCDADGTLRDAYAPALRESLRALDLRAAEVPFPRFAALRNFEDEALKQRVAALRDDARKRVQALQALDGDDAALEEDLAVLRPQLAALCALTRGYGAAYEAKRRARGLLDYNDLEHLTLRLLGEDTPLRALLRGRYSHILVDEYQDTNAAQDALFAALSREEGNLFYVGDVKQSIYGFRQAMPDLFLARRAQYTPHVPGEPVRYPAAITLGHNFRSRREVTGGVNDVFRQLMSEAAAGLTYNDGEALVPAAVYPDLPQDNAAELLLLDAREVDAADARDEVEARLLAGRLRELLDGGFSVTVDGVTRPARWGDVCLLLRSPGSHAAAYARELTRAGIPAQAAGGGFFEGWEIRLALALLRVISNPLEDVPLIALLLSPIAGFTPDDLAALRTLVPAGSLYNALPRAARDGESALGGKCRRLLEQLAAWRMMAVGMPVDELLARLYAYTALPALCRAKRRGAQRAANLHRLQDLAAEYEQTHGGTDGPAGLQRFLRYAGRLEERGDTEAAPPQTGENAVQILSIHKSKGLEYPIVVLAGLGFQHNRESARGPLLLHRQAGIGLMRGGADTPARVRTLPHTGVSLAIARDANAEELRVLYVAMTRAREKLLLAATVSGLPKTLARLAALVGDEPALPAHALDAAKSLGEWLLLAALRHPDAGELRRLADADELPCLPCEAPLRVALCAPPAPSGEEQTEAPAAADSGEPDPAALAALEAAVSYRYPYRALARVPAKSAASDVAERLITGSGGLRRYAAVAATRPALMAATGLTPAERGTALHAFLQHADFAAAARDPGAEADRQLRRGHLTPEQRDSLALDEIRTFFAGPLYRRMARNPTLRREVPFTVDYPPQLLDPTLLDELPADAGGRVRDRVIVQGIADALFEEEGAIVLVDFKSDRVRRAEELVARYTPQIRLYADAFTRVLEMPVKRCLLYSFALGIDIPVELDEAEI